MVAGEAYYKSETSNNNLQYLSKRILSPLINVSNLLSSITEFMFSTHTASTSPSKSIHLVKINKNNRFLTFLFSFYEITNLIKKKISTDCLIFLLLRAHWQFYKSWKAVHPSILLFTYPFYHIIHLRLLTLDSSCKQRFFQHFLKYLWLSFYLPMLGLKRNKLLIFVFLFFYFFYFSTENKKIIYQLPL